MSAGWSPILCIASLRRATRSATGARKDRRQSILRDPVLYALAEEGLLAFDPVMRSWQWELNRIRAKSYSDNVVDLMAGKLKRLSATTQESLKNLACLGNVAEIATLILVQGATEEEMDAAFWEAVHAGLVFRSENAYKFLPVYQVKVLLHTVKSENTHAVDSALTCLRLFGIDVPAHSTLEHVQAEYETVWQTLNGCPTESLNWERLTSEAKSKFLSGIPHEYKARFLRKDGKYRWFLFRWNPLRDEQGRLMRWYVAGTDIEGRKQAEVRSKSNDIIVLQRTDLPEQAKTPGNSFFLYSDNDGSTYLYIEQQQRARLTTFNVTDPSKIKFVSSTMLTSPGAFDFVRPVGGRAELIRFRDGKCRRPRSAYCKTANGEDHRGLVRVRFY